jgi:hypothetical protein
VNSGIARAPEEHGMADTFPDEGDLETVGSVDLEVDLMTAVAASTWSTRIRAMYLRYAEAGGRSRTLRNTLDLAEHLEELAALDEADLLRELRKYDGERNGSHPVYPAVAETLPAAGFDDEYPDEASAALPAIRDRINDYLAPSWRGFSHRWAEVRTALHTAAQAPVTLRIFVPGDVGRAAFTYDTAHDLERALSACNLLDWCRPVEVINRCALDLDRNGNHAYLESPYAEVDQHRGGWRITVTLDPAEFPHERYLRQLTSEMAKGRTREVHCTYVQYETIVLFSHANGSFARFTAPEALLWAAAGGELDGDYSEGPYGWVQRHHQTGINQDWFSIMPPEGASGPEIEHLEGLVRGVFGKHRTFVQPQGARL